MLFKALLNRFLVIHRRLLSTQTVLGIETSCDDTGIAVVDTNGSVLSEVNRSQVVVHLSNGGIIPTVARVLHQQCIDDCVRQCLQSADINPQKLSAVAVTLKPGLPLSLIIGKNYAKTLALKYCLPVIPIHHMEAHALMATINNHRLDYPFVTLLISGGHCLLAIAKSLVKFEVLGQSIDIAPGDLMDKIARRLKLRNLGPPYDQISGGAAIELSAKDGNPFEYFNDPNRYPLYSSGQRSCNFSFTGFETSVISVIRRLEKKHQLDPDRVLPEANDICASLQYAITFMLIKRLQRAFIFIRLLELFGEKPIQLVISGGCACNQFFTNAIKNYCKTENIEVFVPPKKYCSDNGVMIAWNGVLKLKQEDKYPDLILRDKKLIQDLDITSKVGFGEDICKQVIKQHLRCESIDVKQFINTNTELDINRSNV